MGNEDRQTVGGSRFPLPELEEHVCFYPRLKPIVRRRMRTELGLVEGLPRASGSQHVKDGVGTAAIGNTGASPAKAMRVDLGGKEWLQNRPQFIRSLKSCRGMVIGRSRSSWFLGFLFVHPCSFLELWSYL